MKRVLIATPSYDGRVDVWYTSALHQTALLGIESQIYFHPIFMSYDALIQRSRNDLLALAVENNFDGVLWIDSDMEWNPQWAIDVVNSGKDVLGLPVIKKSIDSESYNVKCKPEDLITNDKGFIKVESIGTGFLYMSAAAIKYLWDNSEPYVHNNQDRRWVFEVKIENADIISEDVIVCKKLNEGGFDVFIDPSKTCNHIGTLKFVGNFAEFINKLGGYESSSIHNSTE
jgi:hypothetical protein